MKTINLTGKSINEYANSTNDVPDYFGDKFYPPNSYDQKKVNGEFIAKKYKAIKELVNETKATVKVNALEILISYANGEIKICRDTLTDKFLLPLL